MAPIRRGFIDIAEGQVHFRAAGPEPAAGGPRPLLVFHGSPGSSKQLERFIAAMGETRPVIGLDTMGLGDSSPPAQEDADMAYFADAAFRAATALGLGPVDLFGSHTGARIAVEYSIARPRSVGKMVLDGMSAQVTAQGLDYAKTLDKRHYIDQTGTHWHMAWQTLRDAYLFSPHNKLVAESVRPVGLPPLERLHAHICEILKGIRTSHHAYIAAVLYDSPARLPLVAVPTLAIAARNDTPYPHLDGVVKLIPGCAKMEHPHPNPETLATDAETADLAKMVAGWLDS